MPARASEQTKADLFVRRLVTTKPNLLVPHILIASFLYYRLDSPVISDGLFDEMCNRLLAEWDTVTHPHKHLITRHDLSAGTGFAFDYPDRVEQAARAFLAEVLKPKAKRSRPKT